VNYYSTQSNAYCRPLISRSLLFCANHHLSCQTSRSVQPEGSHLELFLFLPFSSYRRPQGNFMEAISRRVLDSNIFSRGLLMTETQPESVCWASCFQNAILISYRAVMSVFVLRLSPRFKNSLRQRDASKR
jgi:hypothetical protein